MAKLNQDNVIGLHPGEQLVPVALGDKRAGAAAGARAVGDVDLVGIEIIRKGHRPALYGLAGRVSGRGIARDEQGGTGGIQLEVQRHRVGDVVVGRRDIGRDCRSCGSGMGCGLPNRLLLMSTAGDEKNKRTQQGKTKVHQTIAFDSTRCVKRRFSIFKNVAAIRKNG